MLPDYLVEENGGLVQLFGDAETLALDAYFVYPEELKVGRAHPSISRLPGGERAALAFLSAAAAQTAHIRLPFSMADMRLPALPGRRPRHTHGTLCTGCISSQSRRCAACSPLEVCVGPHTGTLKPGPSRGPVFFVGAAPANRHGALESVGGPSRPWADSGSSRTRHPAPPQIPVRNEAPPPPVASKACRPPVKSQAGRGDVNECKIDTVDIVCVHPVVKGVTKTELSVRMA